MKNLFILLIFMTGLLSCSVAPPPADIVLAQTAVVSPGNQVMLAEFILDAVGENHGAIHVNNLEGTENLYASLASQDPVVVEDNPGSPFSFSIEGLVSLVLLVITTLFGARWRKAIGKFKEAVDLLATFHAALEDGNFSEAELADLKDRYYKLINKS